MGIDVRKWSASCGDGGERWGGGWEAFIVYITKTRLFKYIENFTTKKGKFSDIKF